MLLMDLRIDPVTRQVREGVTKNTPWEMGRLCFLSVRSETNLTMGGGEGKQIISLHLVIWKIKGIQLIQILNVYLHVLVLTMKLKAG
jgi:hypothetical protein